MREGVEKCNGEDGCAGQIHWEGGSARENVMKWGVLERRGVVGVTAQLTGTIGEVL